jgi:hypothetical protein
MRGQYQWRVEADDEWLAQHSSANFERLRRRFRGIAHLADAVGQAELGPFQGARSRPQLKIGGRAYSVVRYVTQRISYTTVSLDLNTCRRCGYPLEVRQAMSVVREDGVRVRVGAIRTCRRCQADSWVFHSRMPSVNRARKVSRRVVL